MSPNGSSLRILACWALTSPAVLVDLLKDEPKDESVIVLYFGVLDPSERRALIAACRRRKRPVMIVIDDATVAYLACQAEASRETTMLVTLPFTAGSPYTPDVAGLVPQEMFYGRAEERERIMSMQGSAVVFGGRQLGKSALLRSAERSFDDGDTRHAVYLSIYPAGRATDAASVWTMLWPMLAAKQIIPLDLPMIGDVGAALIDGVLAWVKNTGGQLLLLLDETDRFLDADSADGKFAHVQGFRRLMEESSRKVKVVFAGLHQTARFERLANHPLAHFGEPVCVGPLPSQPAYDLLTIPLDALGFTFEDDALASRVLALANNQPALIQLFAASLLNRMFKAPLPLGAPPQNITEADVDEIWMDASVRAEFQKRFDWTLNLDPRYKVIAYVVASASYTDGVDRTLSSLQLRRLCEQRWPAGFTTEDLRADEFRALLNECVALGVLSAAADGYRLRTPNVRELLGSQEQVEEVLEEASAFDLPESFDGSQYRSPFGSEGRMRSPLIESQVADVLASRNQVRLVIGTPALTLHRAAAALAHANDRAAGGRKSVLVRMLSKSENLANATTKLTSVPGGDVQAVVVADLAGCSASRATAELAEARALTASHSTGTLGVALIAGPEFAAMWVAAGKTADDSCGLTELRRFDATGLRLWLHETTGSFQDKASQAELLSATGGWPILLHEVVNDLANQDSSAGDSFDPLAKLRHRLSTAHGAGELATACGIRKLPALSAAWDFLVRLTDNQDSNEELEVFAELCGMAADEDPLGEAGPLSPQSLVEAGFTSMLDVLEALRMMGVLSPVADKFTCEPVLARATRTLLAGQ